MKISEVIEMLNKIKEENGDLPVYSYLSDECVEREVTEDTFEVLEAQKQGWAGFVHLPKYPKRLLM